MKFKIITVLFLFTTFFGCNLLDDQDTSNSITDNSDLDSNSAPVLNITSHNNTSFLTNSRSLTITGSVTDNDETLSNISVSINSGSSIDYNLVNGQFSVDLIMDEDYCNITVSVTDSNNSKDTTELDAYYVTEGESINYYDFDISGSHDCGNNIVLDDDGISYIAGYGKIGGTEYDGVIWSLNSDGSLNTNFNSTGIVYVNDLATDGAESNSDFIEDITIDSNGKILVVGSSVNSSGNKDIFIARYNSNGSFDTSFNTTGYLTLDINGSDLDDTATGVITTAQNIFVSATSGSDTYIIKYNNDGSFIEQLNFDTGYISEMDIDNQDDLVLVGNDGTAMTIWKISQSLVLDTTFNSTGFVTFSSSSKGIGLTIDDDNNIVVAGYVIAGVADYDSTIWRYTEDGDLDSSFNSVGYVSRSGDGGKDVDYEHASALKIDSYGNIVVVGEVMGNNDGSVNDDAIIWRFTNDGELDTTFNDVGYIIEISTAGGNNLDQARDVVINSKGDILVAGQGFPASGGSNMIFWVIE